MTASEPLTPEALDTIEAEKLIETARGLLPNEAIEYDATQDYLSHLADIAEALVYGYSEQQVELRRLRTENEEQRAVIGMFTNALETRDDGSYGWDDDALDAAAIRAALTGEATG